MNKDVHASNMMPGVALRAYHALTCKHICSYSLYNEKLFCSYSLYNEKFFYVDFLLDDRMIFSVEITCNRTEQPIDKM
jgi:hypothetical protein